MIHAYLHYNHPLIFVKLSNSPHTFPVKAQCEKHFNAAYPTELRSMRQYPGYYPIGFKINFKDLVFDNGYADVNPVLLATLPRNKAGRFAVKQKGPYTYKNEK